MRNNKGFVLMETIIVVSILTIGLLSLYASYVLIIRKANNSNIASPSNSYLAYQVSINIDNIDIPHPTSNPAYNEAYRYGDNYYIRQFSANWGTTSTNAPQSDVLPQEYYDLLDNLHISKIYVIIERFSNIFNPDILLSFDGSTIDYLNSIKNEANINMLSTFTVIVKTMEDGEAKFSYYQNVTANSTESLRLRIIHDYLNSTTSSTTPGVEFSASSERVLAVSLDDYGLSHFYRGNINNNFVMFAGMCWRIVRITGDGSIKLVLYNQNGICNATSIKPFISYNNSIGINYNVLEDNLDSAAYVGFMYGSVYQSETNLTNIRMNATDSNALARLKEWYDLKLRQYSDSLADVIWCNDKSTYETPTNPATASNAIFSGHTRIDNNTPYTDYSITLKCPTLEGEERISKFTSEAGVGNGALNGYKIGLLTADEVAFAGGKASTDSSNSNPVYLCDSAVLNASFTNNVIKSWATMTPNYYNGTSYIYTVNSDCSIISTAAKSEVLLRPAIALVSSTEIMSNSGNGTKQSPYIVVQ